MREVLVSQLPCHAVVVLATQFLTPGFTLSLQVCLYLVFPKTCIPHMEPCHLFVWFSTLFYSGGESKMDVSTFGALKLSLSSFQ